MKPFSLLVCSGILVIFSVLFSCDLSIRAESPPRVDSKNPETSEQIGEYVVEIFEDSEGNLWFGTLGKGVAKYDGNTLRFIQQSDGLAGDNVTTILEDKAGNMWFGTQSGLSKFDGRTFINYFLQDGLCDNQISRLYLDSNDQLWIGTWAGVCQWKKDGFTSFDLPIPQLDLPVYTETANWVTDILEDQAGNMWFSRSGYGVCMYNGNGIRHFTKESGLNSNYVQAMLEHSGGNIWFGSRVGERDHPDPNQRAGRAGINIWDGLNIKKMDLYGLPQGVDVYDIFEDKDTTIWFTGAGKGVYYLQGIKLSLFSKTDRPDLLQYMGIQKIFQDSKNRLWVGCSGGLFRLQEGKLINVTTAGPWSP